MVICLERGVYLHMAQLMPLPLTISCFSKIQIGFTFLVPAHLGSPGKRAVKRVCVCVCACVRACVCVFVRLKALEVYLLTYLLASRCHLYLMLSIEIKQTGVSLGRSSL